MTIFQKFTIHFQVPGSKQNINPLKRERVAEPQLKVVVVGSRERFGEDEERMRSVLGGGKLKNERH